MRLEEYLIAVDEKIKEIESLIASSKINKEIDSNLNRGFLKGRIIFVDGSVLEFMEQVPVEKTKYRFHYMDYENQLILRWDSAPHYRDLDTFPFHLHKPEGVESHTSLNLIEDLDRIEEMVDL